MNRLPTGTFQPGNSIVHKLNATVKLVCLLIIIAAVIATDSLLGYLIVIIVFAAIVYLSELCLGTALSSVSRLIWFFAVILLMNLFFFSPEEPWFSFWIFKPSTAGLLQGINVVARVMLVLVINNVLTVTTAPLELTNGMETLLSPLRYIKIPTEQVAMIISVAIQFIPTLLGETEMIRKAQTARGARFDSRKLHEKAAAVVPLVIPIFLSAFKRADELALAMEARGYRVDAAVKRKRWVKPKLNDYAALVVCLGLLGLEIVVLQSGM